MSEGAGGPGRRRGRRPGPSDTREAILASARQHFTRQGYDAASMREIAQGAGVDPALVYHYFASKDRLFMAAMRLPDLLAALGEALGPPAGTAPLEELGARLAGTLVRLMSDPELPRTVAGLMRTVATNELGAAMVREFIGGVVLQRVGERLQGEDAPLRVNLVASQVFGLLVARLVVRLEPIASAPPEVVAAALGPTLQRYLTGDIAGPERDAR